MVFIVCHQFFIFGYDYACFASATVCAPPNVRQFTSTFSMPVVGEPVEQSYLVP